MSQHQTISSGEAANRLAIRELIEAYAHCADRRDANGQMSLFTADTHFGVYMSARIRSLRRSGCLRSACSTSTGWRSAHCHDSD
jgi:hypothetical protein